MVHVSNSVKNSASRKRKVYYLTEFYAMKNSLQPLSACKHWITERHPRRTGHLQMHRVPVTRVDFRSKTFAPHRDERTLWKRGRAYEYVRVFFHLEEAFNAPLLEPRGKREKQNECLSMQPKEDRKKSGSFSTDI